MTRSDVTPGLQHADKLRRADLHSQLSIGVNLALRNEAQLEAFIAQVSDRKSPNYGRHLTPDQFAATYGPTEAQVQSVVNHLRASGLMLGSVSSNRTIVEATGPVSAVETAFGATISDWHERDQNRDFFGNDTEPTLPAAIASYVVGVAGLNNHYPLHRLGPAPRVGGGPVGGYTPNELKKAYDVAPLASAGYTGSGQRLGLFELDRFRQSNITTYDTQYGLGSPAPTTVLVSGGPPLGNGEIEVELDIEVMHAIAPASPITVWEGPNSDPGANATYNAMVTSNTTKSNSTSWGICEPFTTTAEMTTLDNIFKQGAAQGQSFFAASGDYGAYDCGDSRLIVDSPANDPYVTGTGGTNLTLNADSTYKAESAWSNPTTFPATGSGGGLSGYFARPTWQTGPGVANTYSNGKRQVPDVALDADPQTGYSVYVTYMGATGWNVVGGTSAAAPAWAAFTGVYNQYAAVYGKPNLGYANPTLYSTGSFAQAYPPYHDITAGDNLHYPATANWDYPTGWGSYDAYNLARDLAGTLALTSVQASNVTTTSAVITWQTDHPATSLVDYGTTTSYGSRVIDTTNASNHSVTLSGLNSNTTYHYRAASTDSYGNSGSSADATFTTLLDYSQAPQGDWVGANGVNGYNLLAWDGNDLAWLPQSIFVLDQGSRYSWTGSGGTTQTRALQSPDSSTRRATCIFDANQLRLHLTFSSAYIGTLHIYALDWDSTTRREAITIDDGSGPRRANITTAFDQGAWVNVTINVPSGGVVTITVDRLAGANAVLSGIFLGGPGLPYSQAPQGNWVGTYGANGYDLFAWNGTDLLSLPQSTLTVDQGTRYAWTGSSGTSQVRALESPDTQSRRATCLYDANQLRLRLTFSSNYHGTLHIYSLDWDSTARRQAVTIDDGSGPRTANITTAFDQGAWVNASINVQSGASVNITIGRLAGANAVISGVFLD